MTINDKKPEDLCKQFNALNWHDSKLISFNVGPTIEGISHEISLHIKFLPKDYSDGINLVDNKLILQDCTLAKFDLDLDGKHVCDDSIATAYCSKNSDLKNQIEKENLKHEKSPLKDYYHFRIVLIPPGGEINIFAKYFLIT